MACDPCAIVRPGGGRRRSDRTVAVRAGSEAALTARTVNPPIQRGSTVLAPSAAALYDPGQVTYGRAGLQPHGALCEALSELEGGLGTRLFPSGLAAITGALLGVLSSGDDVLLADCVYRRTRRFCDDVLRRLGVTARYFDAALAPDAVLALAQPDTRAIFLESPGSLTFDLQDIPAIAAAARRRGIVVLVDNTWGAGVLCKPLELGADFSIQALTKYVGGHSDAFMGSVTARTPEGLQLLDKAVAQFGWSVGADDAYQMLRGLRTLPTRLAAHGAAALAAAGWLQAHPAIARVICPALPDFAGHALWRRDFRGQNGLLSVELRSRAAGAGEAFLDRLKLFGLGFSWGGYESLALLCDPQLRERPSWDGRGPLIRLHLGLEDVDDLIEDLACALEAVRQT